MKNILIATDFSPAANNAAMYAVELARLFGAKLHLLYGFDSEIKMTAAFAPFSTQDTIIEAKKRMISEAASINRNKGVDIESYVSDGPVVDAIIETATKCKADIIICGMKEKGKALKKIFGSVVYSLINKTDIPLLVIPEGIKFKKPSQIALAIDLDPETSPATLSAMKKIGEKFYCKISVIDVLNQNYNEADVLRFHPPVNTSELEHLYPTYEFPIGDDIAKTIHNFAVEKKFDILAVVPHKKKWMDRVFTQSITKNLIAYTNRPVMVLPQNKLHHKDSQGPDTNRMLRHQ